VSYACPWCDTVASYAHHFRTHLRGQGRSGGHELTESEADTVVAAIDAGTDIDVLPRAAGRARRPLDLAPGEPELRAPLTAGHRRNLELLCDTDAVRQTLAMYRRFLFGVEVYLRPTDAGLNVISLDAEGCASMIGVGARNTREHVLNVLPPTETFVRLAAAGYSAKRDSLMRRSAEERYVLGCILHAVTNQLRLPGSTWYFLHQEWRLPTTASSGKIDLLAVDLERRQLVVIECKHSPAAAAARDRAGRTAEQQARSYADVVYEHRSDLYPFFERLGAALAAVYDAPPALRALRLDPQHRPMTAVWWPITSP
jgi:hypothetical protein